MRLAKQKFCALRSSVHCILLCNGSVQNKYTFNTYVYIYTGFGGNVIRESVKSHAEWFIMNFDDLRRTL